MSADAATPSIDRFVGAALAARGMKPSPPADGRTPVRRVCFDLTGLPPTPDDVKAFVEDASPDPYE